MKTLRTCALVVTLGAGLSAQTPAPPSNPAVEAKPGVALYMKKGTPHAFTNTGTLPVTVMETFVKPAPAPGGQSAPSGTTRE